MINLVASVEYNRSYLNAPFVGIDKGVSYLLAQNIIPIMAIGDFDSIDLESYQKLEELKIKTIKLNVEKDESDLEAAIKYFYQDYQTINVYGALGKRIDHTLININLLKKYHKLVFYDDFSKVFILKKGRHLIQPEFSYYSFFAIENDTYLDLINFKYELNNYHLQLDDSLCLSNELNEVGQIETNKDLIAVFSY